MLITYFLNILTTTAEDIACSLNRQRGNVHPFAVGGDDGDSGRDTEANVAELT